MAKALELSYANLDKEELSILIEEIFDWLTIEFPGFIKRKPGWVYNMLNVLLPFRR
jgi:hypothetical protein